MADPALKRRLDAGEFIVAPGVFDMMTVLIANEIGFDEMRSLGSRWESFRPTDTAD